MWSRPVVGVASGLAISILSACSDTSTPAPTDVGLRPDQIILCELGCNDPDPSPTAPGFWLGTGMTGTQCVNGTQTDADADQLSDFCEKNLANGFAPELWYTQSDDVGREPHWVAKRLGTSGIKARIAYLLSYYNDWGPTTNWCNNNVIDLFNREACSGHAGDSELIVLDVGYNSTTEHWVVDSAHYSEHGGYNNYPKNTIKGYPTALQYAGVNGGSPRSYVSYQKHANYATEAECDSGAILGTDTCLPQTSSRVQAGGQLNLGSRVHQFQNCMYSGNPIYSGSGRQECYWTDTQKFSGWHIGNPSATPYTTILTGIGF